MKKSLIMFLLTFLVLSFTFGGPQQEGTAVEATTKVVYWSMWNEGEPQASVIKQAIKAYESANPEVAVEVTWNGRENRNLVVPAFSAGQKIDLFDHAVPDVIKQYGLAIDDRLGEPSVDDPSKTVGATLLTPIVDQLKVVFDGKLLGMPYQPWAVLVWYNKDHFDDAGISKEPTNWAEFVATCEALKKAGHAPFTTDPDAYIDIVFGSYASRAFVGTDVLTNA